jgi:hypothetical protein
MDFGGLFQSISSMTAILVIGSLVVTVLILFFVFRSVSRVTGAIGGMNQKTAQLLVSGESAQATVTSLNATGMMVNYNPVVDITLEVRPMGRSPYTAVVRTLIPSIKMAQVQPGMNVGVKFNPNNPSEVAVDLK